VVPEQAATDGEPTPGDTAEHLVGKLDDPSDNEDGDYDAADHNLNDKNSLGLNKKSGTPEYTNEPTDGPAGTKENGYSTEQAKLDGQGHYYIGASRRRVGAGFGRRRRIGGAAPVNATTEEKDAEVIKDLDAGVDMGDDAATPAPVTPEEVVDEAGGSPTAPPTESATPAPLRCPQGTQQVGATNADIPGCGLTSCDERYGLNDIYSCKQRCEAEGACDSFNWAPVGGDKNHMDQASCTMYSELKPTSTWGPNQIFCKMPFSTTLDILTCPEGTEQVGEINADVPGCGLTTCDERYSIHDIDECKATCDANPKCNSFNWAPVGGDKNHMDQAACTMYAQTEPTSEWGPNQIFCRSVEKLTCPENTEQVGAINADVPGCGLTSCADRYTISSKEACRDTCDTNAACNAFTWAPIGGDKNHLDQASCTMYSETAPTSTWGPSQIFCKMPAPSPTPQPTSADVPDPPPTAPVLKIRVTTGSIPHAESDMTCKITITGTTGSFTGEFTTGNAKGAVQTTTLHPDTDIGAVTKVNVIGENGNGWYFTKFEILKSGGNDWVDVGCTDQWLDGEIDSGTYDGKMYGTHIEMTPIDAHCVAATPLSWGPPTDTGCFCKGSGDSGTCANNGDAKTWCRTQDSCIGHSSSHGNWDYCTPAGETHEGDAPCTTCDDPLKFLKNQDYQGNDLASFEDVASPQACCNLCNSNAQCTHWTYGTEPPKQYTCWLKDSATGHEMQDNREAGHVCRA